MLAGNSAYTAIESEAPTLFNWAWRSFLSRGQTWNIYELESAFKILQNYSLIQWRPDQGSYAMHKLVNA